MSISRNRAPRTLLPIMLMATALTACVPTASQVNSMADNAILYAITAANYGTHGIMILKPSLADSVGSEPASWRTVDPGFPGVSNDFRHFDYIRGYPESLPAKMQVVWQLARLSACSYIHKSENYRGYTRKHGCTWTPIEGAIYRKQVDMDAIRASEAYARVGEPEEGSYLLGTYTLVIELIFNEDQLTVRTRSGSTMGYMQ